MSIINYVYNKIFIILKLLFILITITVFLSSCGSKKAKYSPKKKYNPYKYQGSYKVGKPYTIKAETYYPKNCDTHLEEGQASWYGASDDFHGRMTANGDVFRKNMLTAAHKTLPLPSMIEVTNLANGKSATLMVNDRGPFNSKRVLDVSEKSAQALGFKLQGTAKVRIKYLKYETEKLLLKLQLKKKEGSIALQNLYDQKCSVDCYLNNINKKKYSSSTSKSNPDNLILNKLPISPSTDSILPVKANSLPAKNLPNPRINNKYYIIVKNLKSPNIINKFASLHKNLGNRAIIKQKSVYNLRFGPYNNIHHAKNLLNLIKTPYRSNSTLVKAK